MTRSISPLLYFVLFSMWMMPYVTSAQKYTQRPSIISRTQWEAEDSFLYSAQKSMTQDSKDVNAGDRSVVPQRAKDCEEDQRKYPNDFTVAQTDSLYQGKRLRWPRRYSPKISQLVIHHTALEAQHDGRTGREKIQALYDFHANKNGWGDIGYHFVVDEDGSIYEGRSGGDYVVGGHSYCNNVGTIGIALLGNFEIEQPTATQLVSLKWLLDHLAQKYRLDPDGTVLRRGKRVPTIVGHGDLNSTICPGFYMRTTLAQIRRQVALQDFVGRIIFPNLTARTHSNNTETRLLSRLQERGLTAQSLELQPIGSTTLRSRPGGTLRTMVQFNARRLYNGLERIATVERSNSRIGIWQESGNLSARIRKELIIPEKLQPGESIQIPLRFQMPREQGTYSVDIGDITYTFKSEGRRITQLKTQPTQQSFSPEERLNVQTVGYRRSRAEEILGTKNAVIRRRLGDTKSSSTSKTIRIRLHYSAHDFRIDTPTHSYQILRNGNECELREAGKTLDRGIVRVGSVASGISTIASWSSEFNRFRGIIECQIIDSQLVLINEIALEDYMAGLGEEPDTEPYEKQKAFAIAARSYAAFYIEALGSSRKFPGKPYDGSDSPANFQLYKGYVFEQKNPRWTRAVQDTENLVLLKENDILKAAYYSSNDGRTRSPEENGWKGFPHAEVFRSKYDPWCKGMKLSGHGVGMSGCGALGQAKEGKSAEEILRYYYSGTEIGEFRK